MKSTASDLEQEIQRRIEACEKYINGHNNPALVRSYKIEIQTLRSAPRTERELLIAIRRVRRKMDMTTETAHQEPLSAELEALEWLFPIVMRLATKTNVEDNSPHSFGRNRQP